MITPGSTELRPIHSAPAHRIRQCRQAMRAPNLALPWVVRLRYGMATGEVAIVVAIWLAFRLDSSVLLAISPLAIVIASNFALGRLGDFSVRFPEVTLGAALRWIPSA